MYRFTSHATVNPMSPRAFAVCDRCGFLYNHKDLIWQTQWVGPRLSNLKILVCESCKDKPQEQLRTFLIPTDPIPIDIPRPEQYSVQVDSNLSAENFLNLITEDGDSVISEIEDTPSPNPEDPVM